MRPRIQYTCACCHKVHEGLPAISFAEPSYYWAVPEAERAGRVDATADTCVVDGEHFFVRAVLQIPILGEEETLDWGLWGSLSEENFDRYKATFHDDDQSKLGAMFSWLASGLPDYPDTLGLRCRLVPRDNRRRPLIELDTGQDHPLVRDYINGITLDRAVEFVRPVLHPN